MISASHLQTERRNLTLLRDKLLLEEKRDRDEVLAQYGSEVTATFRNLQRFRAFNYDQLAEEESYRASWLSPAILQLIKQQRAQKQHMIFGLCQVEPFMEKDVPAHAVLSNLVSQLLDANVSILRDDTRYQDLSRAFCDPAWRTNNAMLPVTVLQELLNLSPNMHILLDRVDRIQGDPYAFMNSLVSLIKDCKSKIKIFLVASSNGYDRVGGKFSEVLQESVEDDLGSERFWSLERNQ